SSYEFVGQINSKGFQGVFSIFFYTKKMLAKFTNIKKYRAKEQYVFCIVLFFLKFPKSRTCGHRLFPKELLLLPPFIRESVAKPIFKFVLHSLFIF
ncbi:hypothetical protein, partial [Enterococcus durans]|uniref:hypothetical protein n=1 Tax=Enterococcus durans TaxID=53345 RepID=UPI00195B7D09